MYGPNGSFREFGTHSDQISLNLKIEIPAELMHVG
jgi:hypothetical protein